MSSLIDAALGYAARGWELFPLHSPGVDGKCSCLNPECGSIGKHPRTQNGMKDATTDIYQIRKWWTQWPDANIGRRPSANDIVLDLDGIEGVKLEKEFGVPLTPTIATGKGIHALFIIPEGVKVFNRARYLPGLDIRTHGGYHILPPSLHYSGKRYRWIEPPEIPLAECPPWLVQILRERDSDVKTYSPENGKIPRGKRNETLFSMGLRLYRDGALENAVYAALSSVNQTVCEEPLSEGEVKQIVGSIDRKSVV